MDTFGSSASLKLQETKLEPLPWTEPPFSIYEKLRLGSDYSFILDSVVGPEKLSEYSFLGFAPELVIRAKDGYVKVEDENGNTVGETRTKDPLMECKKIVNSFNATQSPFRFVGGAVGYVSYDSIRYWERIQATSKDELNYPDMEFGVFTDGLVFDHRRRKAHYFHLGKDRFEHVKELIARQPRTSVLKYTEPKANVSKERFERAVKLAKEYIQEGEIFQAVLSRRLDIEVDGYLPAFYKALLEVNPSPYMYFVEMGHRKIVGSSPEMLVRVTGDTVETFPIAGTRPRVNDSSENSRLRKELLADPKDRAEHVMLVDLARNDLGRVCEYGSVKVAELMSVHEYSHVQHIVSRVMGKLKHDYDSFETLKAVFPAGTVSGAPKVRAMEIIEELEPSRRGPYAGALGYFSFNGNSDFAITIRTMTLDGNRASLQVGAGIVADSVPEKEWFETENKGQAVLAALKKAGEVKGS